MPTYKYIVRDQAGRSTSGSIEARDPDELRRIFRTNGLFLTEYHGSSASLSDDKKPYELFPSKPKLQDLVVFTRQLSTLLRAGVPVNQALRLTKQQCEKRILAEAIADLETSVEGGSNMSSAMRRYPSLFNPLLVSLVEAGEASGNLDYALNIASEQLEREHAMYQKVGAALAYPKVVVAACVGTIVGMLFLVVPVFANVYEGMNARLPGPTLALLNVSEICTRYWWLLLVLLVGGVIGYKRFAKTKGGSRYLDTLSLKIPVMGEVFRKIAIARFVQTLAGAFRGGVPMLLALTISGKTSGNAVIRDAVAEVTQRVHDGSEIAEELERSEEFPLMFTHLVAAGEASGNLDEMLEEVNRFYERDIEMAVNKMTRMIEPIMTVLIGSIVLFVLLALYMPVFSLGKTMMKQ